MYCVYKTENNFIERGKIEDAHKKDIIFESDDEREVVAFYCAYMKMYHKFDNVNSKYYLTYPTKNDILFTEFGERYIFKNNMFKKYFIN